MSNELTPGGVPARPRLARRNSMAFPRELRSAIPDLHNWRDLELDSIDGHVLNMPLFGPLVRLKMVVKETGKLKGRFVVLMDLQPDAARQLATTLTTLANGVEN